MYTLLDLRKLEAGIGSEIIEENIALAPELRILPAATISGSAMSLTVRTDLPSVAFRHANEGTPRSKGGYTTRTFEAAILDHQVAVDVGLLDGAKPEAKGRLLSSHMSGAMEAAFRKISKQFYYGTGEDAKGFPGLIAQLGNNNTIDATGAAAKSSVWMLSVGSEKLEFLYGNGQTITMDEQWKIETVYDASNRPFQAWTNWLKGRVGLRLANKLSAVRISNIGTAAGKTLTGDLLTQAYQKMTDDFGMAPTHLFMTGRSRSQLRDARKTVENPDPPLPTEWNGIPIVTTHGISNAETV
jgi:hypothetical protein